MNCEHPEKPSKDFDNEDEYRNLCAACRRKALSQMTTPELIKLKKLTIKAQRGLFAQLLKILPELLNAEFGLSEALSDPTLTDDQMQRTRLVYQSIVFAVSAIHRFEINEILNERARKG